VTERRRRNGLHHQPLGKGKGAARPSADRDEPEVAARGPHRRDKALGKADAARDIDDAVPWVVRRQPRNDLGPRQRLARDDRPARQRIDLHEAFGLIEFEPVGGPVDEVERARPERARARDHAARPRCHAKRRQCLADRGVEFVDRRGRRQPGGNDMDRLVHGYLPNRGVSGPPIPPYPVVDTLAHRTLARGVN
jgi:hypothetical protein